MTAEQFLEHAENTGIDFEASEEGGISFVATFFDVIAPGGLPLHKLSKLQTKDDVLYVIAMTKAAMTAQYSKGVLAYTDSLVTSEGVRGMGPEFDQNPN